MTKALKDSHLHVNKLQSESKNLMKKTEHKISTAIQSTIVQVKGLHTPLHPVLTAWGFTVDYCCSPVLTWVTSWEVAVMVRSHWAVLQPQTSP